MLQITVFLLTTNLKEVDDDGVLHHSIGLYFLICRRARFLSNDIICKEFLHHDARFIQSREHPPPIFYAVVQNDTERLNLPVII